jgi:23S rRNA maturation-related 3'-5' exoribonuclease YhaM
MRVILGKEREERILSVNEIVYQISEWLIEEVNEGLNEGYE